jgi:hypothetical protein
MNMSALDLLPENTRVEIARGNSCIRADLRMIQEAEAEGWRVTFRDGHWHNSAMFKRDKVTVWSGSLDYRRAELIDGHYATPTVFPYTIDGLRAALRT